MLQIDNCQTKKITKKTTALIGGGLVGMSVTTQGEMRVGFRLTHL